MSTRERAKKFLKAAEGRRVKDPETLRPLADVGEWKVMNSFWHRRLSDADVVEAQPPQVEAAPATRAKQQVKTKPADEPAKAKE